MYMILRYTGLVCQIIRPRRSAELIVGLEG